MKKIVYLLLVVFAAGTALAQTVEFNVNMSIKALKGTFTPGERQVFLAGNFNGWNTSATEMTDNDNDSIYTTTIDTFAVDDTLYFKFITVAGSDIVWESDPNREYVVPSGSSTFSDYFDRDSLYEPGTTKNVAITFSCNMEFEIVSGRYNPATDTLTVRGSFNGWSGDDIMSQSASDPNYYEKTVDYVTNVGEEIAYKYAYINATGVAWEGDPNKTYTISQDDYDNGTAFTERTYNDLTLDNVTNNIVTIKFVVNVNGAVSSVTGQPFESIDNVVLCGANPPLQWPGGGWPDSDSLAVKDKFLFNDGTHGDEVADDSLWSLDLDFPQYSPLRIQYKYGANWALDSLNTGSNDNESSVGTDHFLNLTSDLLSATVRNQWSVMGDHELVDVVVTGVDEISSSVPSVYSLSQNYPNPFNPTTNIRFAVPEAGLVTMKVYNLLGQEVATLLNEYKNAGTYNVDFNAVNLSSGVYFYQINAGNYSDTKKMILMK
jgi:hypothetical protein